MCISNIPRYNVTGRTFGSNYKYQDPLGAYFDRKSVATGAPTESALTPVPAAEFVSPNASSTKGRNNFATGATSLLGG